MGLCPGLCQLGLQPGVFRDGLCENLGFPSIEALIDYWIADHLEQDANDLLVQLDTWQRADVTGTGTGTGRLRELPAPKPRHWVASAIPMPGSTDLYFTAADARIDAQHWGPG
ncbi:MAG: hypothetical protein R3E50_02475 [Halioglobus sp.]